MLLGPVFNIELVTAARRPRNYVIRFIYGSILLFFIWRSGPVVYYGYYGGSDLSGYSHQQLAEIGQSLFTTFLIVQGITVLLITPALVAGVIADEKQRKTLHYLLASSLSSFEIVVGKLTSRMLQLGVVILIGIPILSLLSLFGGVEPVHIVSASVATLTTAFFLSSLSILISVQAKRPREALSLVYLLEVCWLFGPSLIRFLMPMGGAFWSGMYGWIRPVNELVAVTSPFYMFVNRLPAATWSNPGAFLEFMAWICGLQVAYGIVLLVIAVLTLRPVFRRQGDGTRSKGTRLTRRGRFFARPECGEDAMLWKERYVSRSSILTKVVGVLVGITSGAFLAYVLFDYFAWPAFRELASNGYGQGGMHARQEFNSFLRSICTFIYALWMIALASAASAGLTSEREEDTWISLISTPLSGFEIIRAKMFGAFWGLRWVGVLMLALWLLGVAAGAVHPLGLILIVIETAIYLGFATALGTYLSLRSSKSSRALLETLGLLFFVNGGYLLCCIPLEPSTQVVALGVTPMVEMYSLLSYSEIAQIFDTAVPRYRTFRDFGEVITLCFLSLLAYSIAAVGLTVRSVDRFDLVVDRPRRRSWSPPRSSDPAEIASKAGDSAAKKQAPEDEIAS